MVRLCPPFDHRSSSRLTRSWWALLVAVIALLVPGPIGSHPAVAAPTRSMTGPRRPVYVPPVADGVITDHFRPPPSPYAAGNRGIDEVTRPGSVVVASADGRVIFAGPAGGSLHITVLHADGLRSSYSYLAAIGVRVGDVVGQGSPIALTGPIFHFGVRDASGTYLDPEALFGGRTGAHLVAGPDEGAAPLDRTPEPSVELRAFAAIVAAGRSPGSRLAQQALAVGHEVVSASTPGSLVALAAEVERWHDQQRRCTPVSTPVPPPRGRRIAILVGGLGSSADHAAVDHVDTVALGYRPPDVVRFSYGGGRVPPPSASGGALAALASTSYEPLDTEVDLHRSADRLLELIADVARVEPGVPIDLIAHSQGGVVARLAVASAADRGHIPAGLGTVVTLGTPHQGADLATALTAIDPGSAGARAIGAEAQAAGVDLDLTRPAIAQLGQTSPVASELARPVPPGVHLVSVGASGDLTVPDVRTVAAGADHVTVHLSGPHAHDRLPAATATRREIGLAIAGSPPTCADLLGGLTDVVTSHLIAQAEDTLGLTLAGLAP